MLYGQDRRQLRGVFIEAWRKRLAREPLTPLEDMIAALVDEHPEYHALLANEDNAIEREWSPELGETNPFLHLGMHIAVREQLSVDRPPGVRQAYRAILARSGDTHQTEHRMMECLAETLWQAQRTGNAPDDQKYLDCLKRI